MRRIKFLLTIDTDLLEAVKARAKELNISTSSYIRLVLTAAIKKKGGGVL